MPLRRLRAPLLAALALTAGCFDPETPAGTGNPGDTDTDSATDSDTVDTSGGPVCEAGATLPCMCEDGSAGTQTCSGDGLDLGSCVCETADSSTTDPTDPSASSSGPPPECEVADDCTRLEPTECEQAACDDGSCVIQALDAGTPCGDETVGECSDADSCDGKGACVVNDVADGLDCATCDLGVCTCTAGACGDCMDFAPTNNFVTPRSIAGWTLAGGWGLYRQAPQNFSSPGVTFDSQVFGTDGNRIAPYPGSDNEESTARTRPTIIPANLEFLSWNVDEGSGVDTKLIRASIDGGNSFVTIHDCQLAPAPFCTFRDETRAADDWDAISLPVPPQLVGQVGVIEFYYRTGDPCCGFERGWFLDELNFATECACLDDAGCEGLGGDCGAAECTAVGECVLDAVAAGTDCGDDDENQCNAPDACDGVGYCATAQATNGLTDCTDCDAGAGGCNACQEGVCADCEALSVTNDFSDTIGSIAGWQVEDLSGTGADWQIYSSAPQSQITGSVPTPLSFAPSFGTDGNRQAPYPGLELEHSRITTAPDTVPDQISFSSWNVDEGSTDFKIIEISVDDGANWTTLVHCQQGIGVPQPFCNFRNDARAGNDWDAVVLDTAAFAGMEGRLRFTYNTQDACCNFERGWFIDNLDFGEYCTDSPFP